jgi:hypothetical protein
MDNVIDLGHSPHILPIWERQILYTTHVLKEAVSGGGSTSSEWLWEVIIVVTRGSDVPDQHRKMWQPSPNNSWGGREAEPIRRRTRRRPGDVTGPGDKGTSHVPFLLGGGLAGEIRVTHSQTFGTLWGSRMSRKHVTL